MEREDMGGRSKEEKEKRRGWELVFGVQFSVFSGEERRSKGEK